MPSRRRTRTTGSAALTRCLHDDREVAGCSRDDVMVELPGFEGFFAREADRLLRMLCVITGSRVEAEDIAQEAFTRVFERWDQVEQMDDPAGYLHRTAMNAFRSQYRRAVVAAKRVVVGVPAQEVFQRIEDRDTAIRALAALTPRERAALVVTELLGYSGAEAAELLGIKASTVWALTHQARSKLARLHEAADV